MDPLTNWCWAQNLEKGIKQVSGWTAAWPSHGFQCKVHSLTITWLSVQSSQPHYHMAFSAKFTASLSHGFQCKVHSLTITWLSVQSSQPHYHMAFSAKFTASLSHGFQCKVHSLTITWLSVQSSQPHYHMAFSVSSQFPWATCQNWWFLFFPAMEMVSFGRWPCFIVLRTED